jgi:hypothetical protein
MYVRNIQVIPTSHVEKGTPLSSLPKRIPVAAESCEKNISNLVLVWGKYRIVLKIGGHRRPWSHFIWRP